MALSNVPQSPAEEQAVGTRGRDHLGPPLDHPGGGLTVRRVMIFPAQPRVVDPRRLRHRRVEVESPPALSSFHGVDATPTYLTYTCLPRDNTGSKQLTPSVYGHLASPSTTTGTSPSPPTPLPPPRP